jgi:hypothetical protein
MRAGAVLPHTMCRRRIPERHRCAGFGFHDVVVGLHAFGEKALRLGRGGDQFSQRAQADAAGESRRPRTAQFDKPERGGVLRVAIRQERIFEGAMCGHEPVRDYVIDAGGCAQAHHIPRALLDLDILLREQMSAKPLLAITLVERLGDQNPARQRAA